MTTTPDWRTYSERAKHVVAHSASVPCQEDWTFTYSRVSLLATLHTDKVEGGATENNEAAGAGSHKVFSARPLFSPHHSL